METLEKLKLHSKLHSIVVDNTAVGERIRQIRESLPGKPNQEEFYEILYDVPGHKDKVSEWERAVKKKGPGLQDIARIAAVGDVSIEWLLTGKGKGISPTVSDSSPTLRDYCELLFVDMPRRFGVKWEIPAHGVDKYGVPVFSLEDGAYISFSLPLPCTMETGYGWGRWRVDGGPFLPVDGCALLECAEHMQAVQSLPADTRRMVEKDLLSKVPAVPVPPLDDDSKPL